MRTRCPHCDSELEVPASSTAVVCTSCRRAFSVLAEAPTMTELRLEEPTGELAPTASTRRLRVNCPRCHKEMDVPSEEADAVCPRCGESFQTQHSTEPDSDAAIRGTARTRVSGVTTPTAESRDESPSEAALQWLQTHFEGRYEILGVVGRGGMGMVYKARQLRPARDVALKLMLGGAFASQRHRRRFEREAQAVAMLKHPAIVPVYEFGEAGGQPYFTMEFVEGRDLRSYVMANRLSREETCRMMVRVLDAIHHAHQCGVIHRDLKPGNILVDRTARPRVLDFGLSRTSVQDEETFSNLTVTGDFLGTPRYASPEQAFGRPRDIDRRTDIYALGVIFYELLAGMPPYPIDRQRGLKAFEILRDWDPVKPRDLHPDIARDLEVIMLKAIEKDRERRYQTAEAFAQDLESFLQDRPIKARPATLTYRLGKWAHRNRRVLVPIALSLIVLTVLSAAFINQIIGLTGALKQRSREKELLRTKTEGFLRGRPNAKALVEELMGQDHWRQAYSDALAAPGLLPDEPGVSDLAAMVQRRAEAHVEEALGLFSRAVRQQDYEGARAQASDLAALAIRLPETAEFQDLRDRLATVEPAFVQRCWDDLRAAIDEAYGRTEVLERLDAYGRFAGALAGRPHLQETTDMRGQLAAEAPEYFLDKHVRAFRRAVSALDWEEAEAVLGSAQQVILTDVPRDPDEWHRNLAELRGELDLVIRQATARKVRWLRTLQKPAGPVGESAFVRSLAVPPDGAFLAAGARDGTVTLWEAASGKMIGEPLQCMEPLRPIAVSPDGALLAAGGDGGFLQLWSLADRTPARRLHGHEHDVRSVGFSPDGRLLVSADRDRLILWDPSTGERVEPGNIEGTTPAMFSPDGRLLAAADTEDRIRLWDVHDRKWRHTLPSIRRPQALAFSPDGAILAVAFAKDTVTFWDPETGSEIGRFPPVDREILALAFSPDGRLFATGGTDKTVTFWDVQTRRPIGSLEGHRGRIFAVAFTPDQRLLATGSADATVQVWGLPRDQGAPAADAPEQ